MTTKTFLVLVTTAILILFAALLLERYTECMQNGGSHCRLSHVGF